MLRVSSGSLNYWSLSKPSWVCQPRRLTCFARKVSMRLKPGSIAKFSLLMEREVIPKLRKQNGFQDEITFFVPSNDDVFEISFWGRAENAEAYNRGTYPAVLKILSTLTEGTPKVETYEVVNSTFHKIAAAVAA